MRGKSAIALLLMLVFALTCMGALAEGSTTEHTVTIHYNGHGNPSKSESDPTLKYPESVQVPDGAPVSQPYHDVEIGWELKGWYQEVGGVMQNTEYDFNTPVTENITIAAKWEQLKYTVTFDANCSDTTVTGMPNPISEVMHGERVQRPAPDPTRTGYDFKGWYLETSGINEFKFDTDTVTQDITLYAKWERTQWTVTFDTDNGVQTFTQTVNDGEKASKPVDPAKQGYKFTGWYNGGAEYNFDTPVTAGITLTAQWTKVYKVVFNMNGHGDTIKPVSVAANENIKQKLTNQEVPQPTEEGYAFGGWYADQAFTGNEFNFDQTAEAAAKPTDSTINLYAKWTAKVTVKFEVGTSVTHEYDGTHPDKVQVQLYKNGVSMGDGYKVSLGDKQAAVWGDLPADSVYTVREVSVPENFTEVCTRNGENNYTITNVPKEKYAVTVTNTHAVDKIDIMVRKIWEDNNNKHRPKQIQVKVSWTEGSTPHEEILTLNEGNNWTDTLSDQYKRNAGQIIQYKIEEIDNLLGYKATCEVVVDEAGNYSVRIVNVLTGKLDIQGEKKWEDDNDRDGIRPESVQLKIYENVRDDNHLVAIVIVDNSELIGGDQSRWSWRLEDLPVYDEFDRPITYIVVEDPVPEGYTATGPQYITVNVNNNSTNN